MQAIRRDHLKFALAQFDFPVGAVARNGERVRELIARRASVARSWSLSRS